MKPLSIILILTSLVSSAFAQDGERLHTILERALVIHPRIMEAKASLDFELARKDSALSPYRPMLSANGYFAGGNGSPIFPSTVAPVNWIKTPADGVAAGNLMLMWRVWTGGRDATARDLSDARIEGARHILKSVEQDVALEVRLAYGHLDHRKKLYETHIAHIEKTKEAERIAKLREQAGKSPRAFVLRAEAETSKAERLAAIAKANMEKARYRLIEAAGGQADIGDTSILMFLEAPESLGEALQVSGQRSELAFFESMAKAQGLEATMVRQSLRPEVSFMAMGTALESSRSGTMDSAKFGLIVSIPLIDGGLRRAQTRQFEANRDKFLAQMEQMRLMVRRQVESAWADWVSSDAVLESSLAGLKSARESYSVEKLRFENGKSILTELLDSQTMLLEADAEVLEAERFRDASWSKLMRAMGEAPEVLIDDH